MAKPLSSASAASSGPSTASNRRRRRPRSPPAPRAPRPSQTLLALLATIAAADPALSSPAPPSFLCPSLPHIDSPQTEHQPPPSSPIIPHQSAIHREPYSRREFRQIPDKYEQGTDGVWRRVDYSLYGKSACPSGIDCRKPNNAVAVDDQIKVVNNTITTPSFDIKDQLPPGWKPVPKTNEGHTTLILILSLVLAFFICLFIIGCLFWRKASARKRRYYDVEARGRRRRHRRRPPTEEELRDAEVEKEEKVQQKVWARATARWKANVRYSARQRRGKRMSTTRMSQAHQSSLSIDSARGRRSIVSSTHSRTSSRRSSAESTRDRPREEEEPDPTPAEQTPSTSDPPQASTSSQVPTSGLPPAYQHGQIPPIIVSFDEGGGGVVSSVPSGLSTPANVDRSRRPSHSSITTPSTLSHLTQNSELYPSVAHVATDDKSLLARLADLASAPPDEDDASVLAEGSQPQVSAPVWQDEDIEDFEDESRPDVSSPDASTIHSPAFPPPPSKERLAAAELLEYSFTYDELADAEAELEPSAPPFEEEDSLATAETALVPSAPPLVEDDLELEYVETMASAPQLDEPETTTTDESADSARDEVAAQDHDRMDTAAPAETPERSSSSTPSSGHLTLPGYHP